MERICSKCNKRNRRGGHSWCNPCLRVSRRASRYIMKLKRDYKPVYHWSIFSKCSICKEFLTSKNSYSNGHSYCRNCTNKYSEEYYIENKDNILEFRDKESHLKSQKKYYKKNKEYYRELRRARRARIKGSGGTMLEPDWIKLCERYGYICLACGKEKPLTQDHVIPLSQGGAHDISNIQPLCRKCNSSKGNRVIIDFRLEYPILVTKLHEEGEPLK